jgi:hypothetical protein
MKRHNGSAALAAGLLALLLAAGEARAAVVVRTAVAYRPHPVARAAVGTAVVAGAGGGAGAVVGSRVRALPPACTSTMVGNVAYQQCGSTWYQPHYAGSSVTYVVVNPPR